MIKKIVKQKQERVINYDEVTAKIKAAVEDYIGKSTFDDFMNNASAGVDNIVGDLSEDEIKQWCNIAKSDNAVSSIVFAFTLYRWGRTHEDSELSLDALTSSLATLGVVMVSMAGHLSK